MALQLSTYPLLFQVTTSLKKVERRGEILCDRFRRLGVNRAGTLSSADLGGSSNY